MNFRSHFQKAVGTTFLAAVAGVVLGCNAPLSTAPVLSRPGTTTTIILVRHAERDPGLDPPLNAEGEVRAQALANVLNQNGVTAILSIGVYLGKSR